MQQPFHFFLLLFIISIIYSLFLTAAVQPSDFKFANVSTKWINNEAIKGRYVVLNGGIIRNILFRDTSGPDFGCGFTCLAGSEFIWSCELFLFSIFIGGAMDDNPEIVWSANRDRPVRENATLEFTKNGDLVLQDFDGTLVWSTNTSGKSVVAMELNKAASLVLFDEKNNAVWSSVGCPTDSLVLGQKLREGQHLIADVSPTNSSPGPFHLNVVSNGIQAFVGSQLYYNDTSTNDYVSYNNGSLYIIDGSNNSGRYTRNTYSFEYMQFDYAGRLRVYGWDDGWVLLKDLDFFGDDECGSPNICGEYGICFKSNGQCSCPASDEGRVNYFIPVDHMNPNQGCVPVNALSCESAKTHQLLSLINVNYFYNYFAPAYMENTNVESCKQACLANCSCKVAFFIYDDEPDASHGSCYWSLELYSLTYNTLGGAYYESSGRPCSSYYHCRGAKYYKSSAFIKVQPFHTTNLSSGTNPIKFVKSKQISVEARIGASVASLVAFILIVACVIALLRRRYTYREVEDADEFDMLPGLPTRFAFEDLRVATSDFLQKLGQGGFGSVFEGTLVDGTKIAVKRLEGVGQGKKEFLTEVETIGSIHHLHLVKLIGFCAEKSHRLLVYEYMFNGSLDKWIFCKDQDIALDWETRRKIITDIAKGLMYLHEECRQKIVHLDIKPQNILLDENFNAKVSDFGLAKLIDRDQIEVMTRMRGTPGYLAPEWLTSIITEKIDVFSFGVVVLEIVCGRKNLDRSKDDESFHLIGLLQRKVAENKLLDMVDCRCIDMKAHIDDVIMIIHLAMWCIQSDSNKRPLMSMVLRVLEGSLMVETDLNYNFSDPTPYVSQKVNVMVSALPLPSILSGPR